MFGGALNDCDWWQISLVNILLTGSTGFVGRGLVKRLNGCSGLTLTGVIRRESDQGSSRSIVVEELDSYTDWSAALLDQQVVIHAAARAHIMADRVCDPLSEYRRVNVDGTLNLARQAAAAGVRRFVFISSIKVNGEQTSLGELYTAEDIPAPKDPYGVSKLEAELGLQQLADETGLEVVIIRPPLVYGPNVKGNFASMVKLVKRGWPLPLGAVNNERSLVALDNLVDLIVTCTYHPNAANEVFLVSDGQDLSTTELLREIARVAGKPSRLVPVPESVLGLIASCTGKTAVAQRLLGSLQVDISKTRRLLGWSPPVGVEEGIRRMYSGN